MIDPARFLEGAQKVGVGAVVLNSAMDIEPNTWPHAFVVANHDALSCHPHRQLLGRLKKILQLVDLTLIALVLGVLRPLK